MPREQLTEADGGIGPELLNSSYAEAFKQLENVERILVADASGQVENRMTPQQLRNLINVRIDQQKDNKVRVHLQSFQEQINALLDAVPDNEKSVFLTGEKITEIQEMIRAAKSGLTTN